MRRLWAAFKQRIWEPLGHPFRIKTIGDISGLWQAAWLQKLVLAVVSVVIGFWQWVIQRSAPEAITIVLVVGAVLLWVRGLIPPARVESRAATPAKDTSGNLWFIIPVTLAVIILAVLGAKYTPVLGTNKTTNPYGVEGPSVSVPVTESTNTTQTTFDPTKEGPKLLMKYEWRWAASDSVPIELFDDGTESALNVRIDELQRGPWAVQFKPIPIIEKGQHLRISPSTVLALSPHRHSVAKPQLGAFLRRVIADKDITEDPLQVTVRIIYRSASVKDDLESHYVIEYSRSERKAVARYLGNGMPRVVASAPVKKAAAAKEASTRIDNLSRMEWPAALGASILALSAISFLLRKSVGRSTPTPSAQPQTSSVQFAGAITTLYTPGPVVPASELRASTAGVGVQKFDIGVSPSKLVFEPSKLSIDVKDLPREITLEGGRKLTIACDGANLMVNDHGQRVPFTVFIHGQVPLQRTFPIILEFGTTIDHDKRFPSAVSMGAGDMGDPIMGSLTNTQDAQGGTAEEVTISIEFNHEGGDHHVVRRAALYILRDGEFKGIRTAVDLDSKESQSFRLFFTSPSGLFISEDSVVPITRLREGNWSAKISASSANAATVQAQMIFEVLPGGRYTVTAFRQQ